MYNKCLTAENTENVHNHKMFYNSGVEGNLENGISAKGYMFEHNPVLITGNRYVRISMSAMTTLWQGELYFTLIKKRQGRSGALRGPI